MGILDWLDCGTEVFTIEPFGLEIDMPKIKCLCGELINLSPIPNRQSFHLIWEPLIEKLADNLVTAHQQAQSDEDFEQQVYELLLSIKPKPKFQEAYECFNCKRLVIFARASDNVPAFWYQQERANTDVDSLRSLVDETIDNQADGI
ncbi:hypothetical protein NIES21_02100 [Anabaenopsis circularis NIES-21]|uniref:Uncharacterized protein n=1 Tax=Anabaenopsis circularis NIES-21 TaxID=1085406 RepID=A0A1Z4GAB0_9CYAN|nr:hypothetical protein NIES21_02100 [Anabaenopsis circularis NIES-21]